MSLWAISTHPVVVVEVPVAAIQFRPVVAKPAKPQGTIASLPIWKSFPHWGFSQETPVFYDLK